MPKKPTVFISHIHEHAAIATRLADWIRKHLLGALTVFVSSDGASIRGGDQWMEKIEEALCDAQVVIVLCSPDSLKRPWVFFEAGGAFFMRARVIPICLPGLAAGDLPTPLSFLQAYELSRPEHLRQLIEILAEYAGLMTPEIDAEYDAKRLTRMPELGRIYTGKVIRTTTSGALVEIEHGHIGMLSISQLADYRVVRVEDVVGADDEVMVMVIDISREGRIQLSRKAVLEGFTLEEARADAGY